MARPQSKELQAFAQYGLVLVALTLVIALVGGWMASLQSLNITNRSKLERSITSLQSYAAETQLVVTQYQMQRTTDNYVKVSAVKLQRAVSSLGDGLETQPADGAVKAQVQDVTDQISKLEDILGKLSRLPGPDEANQLNRQLASLTQEVSTIL